MFECSFEQLKKIVAALIAGAFLLFVSGYYLGKKTATESLMAEVESVAFADRIYSSLCTLYPSCSQEQEGPDSPDSSDVTTEEQGSESESEVEFAIDSASSEVISAQGSEQNEDLYYAPLAGYGTHEAALAVQKRFDYDGIKTVIREKHATSARGKKRLWYQIVTQPYTRKELDQLIQKIKKPYKLTDITILEYKEKD